MLSMPKLKLGSKTLSVMNAVSDERWSEPSGVLLMTCGQVFYKALTTPGSDVKLHVQASHSGA
jgi:hypothetical protein